MGSTTKAELEERVAELEALLTEAARRAPESLPKDISKVGALMKSNLSELDDFGVAAAALWDYFIDCLILAEEFWSAFEESTRHMPPEIKENLPTKVQKAIAWFPRARFVVMLPRFVDFYRAQGGLEAMKVDSN